MQVRLPPSGRLYNYILNPSAEAAGGYSAVAGATVTRDSTRARQVTPDSASAFKVVTGAANDGLQLTTAALPSSSIYMSAWVYVESGSPAIRFKCNATTLTPTLYETDGAWQWYVLDDTPWTSGQAGGQTAVQVLDATGSATFYVDDAVVSTALTSAFHGSYAGCGWAGIHHQSVSYLDGRLPNGDPNLSAGVIYDLQNSWLIVNSLVGGGMPDLDIQEQAIVGQGRVFQTAQLNPRTLVLQGVTLRSTSLDDLHDRRSTLLEYVAPGERFIFRYRGNSNLKGGTNDVLELEVVYVKGLEGNWSLPMFEETVLTLKAHDPLFKSTTDTATALNFISSTTLAFAIRRLATGGWEIPGGGTGPGMTVYAFACSPKGHIFAGGTGGSDNLRGWDGTSWADCGVMTGTKTIRALAFDPSGTVLYVGGTFANFGGVVCNNIAKYTLPASGVSGGTVAALGGTPGTNNTVYAIITVPTSSGHDVYAFGTFTQAGGASANYAAKWNGSAWSTLGPNTATATGIYCADLAPDLSIYFGGAITSIGTISTPVGVSVSNTTGNLSSGNWGYRISALTGTGETLAATLAASGTSSTGKSVTWTAVTGATGYKVYRESSAGGGASVVAYLTTVTTNSFTDTGQFTLGSAVVPTAATDGCRTTNVGRYFTTLNYFVGVGQSGLTGQVNAIAVAPDGVGVYAGGAVTAGDGVPIRGVGYCNGLIWSAMGDNDLGGGVTGGNIQAIKILPTGEVAVGGSHTSLTNALVGTLGANLAYWIPGSIGATGVWVHSDVTFPSSTTVYALMVDHNKQLWVGFDTNGSATTSATTTVTQSGMAGAFLSYPRLYIQGPGVLRYLENLTTAHRLWLNLTIATDEVIIMDLRRGYKTLTSNLNTASRASRFVAGDLGEFGLRAGNNTIVAYYTGTSGNAAMKIADPNSRISADR